MKKNQGQSDITCIPYEDLWCSAIRCKLIYRYHNYIKTLWGFVNREECTMDAIDKIDIDEAYIRELRNISEPIYFDTKSKKGLHKHNTLSYVWHTNSTIYITIHTDKYTMEEFIQKHDRMICIYDNIDVNGFFYMEMLVIMDPILTYIEELIKSNPDHPLKIVVAGYSLGGVVVHIMSAILGSFFSSKGVRVCCHTFGSPKAGNKEFVKWFNSNVKENYRIINGKDPITLYPIDSKWCHVPHTTLQFDIENHINQRDQENMTWYKRMWLKYYYIRKILKKKRHDHDLDIYTNRLWKYARITKYIETSSKPIDI